jgi:hypothetical protein
LLDFARNFDINAKNNSKEDILLLQRILNLLIELNPELGLEQLVLDGKLGLRTKGAYGALKDYLQDFDVCKSE